jgi:hypothetical protein
LCPHSTTSTGVRRNLFARIGLALALRLLIPTHYEMRFGYERRFAPTAVGRELTAFVKLLLSQPTHSIFEP